jgi:heterodisulfide reductase subunit C
MHEESGSSHGEMKMISMSKTDPGFARDVARKIGLERINPCYACGSCVGVCPVHEVVEDFDPRRIIHMILLGMRKEVLTSDLIWLCCLCNSCLMVCPQRIKFSRVAGELQAMAMADGLVRDEFLAELSSVRAYLRDLCRRTMFRKVRDGSAGTHKVPCWRKTTKE